jgi:carbamoyl-phosphate synthase large subunit
MKSTGEVMGVGKTFGEAFAKSQAAAGVDLPVSGCVFISVRKEDKEAAAELALAYIELGFTIVATDGTANFLDDKNISCQHVNKVRQGRPHVVDMIIDGQIDLIINTTEGKQAIADSFTIRRKALQQKICTTTTITGAWAMKQAIEMENTQDVYPLQELHDQLHS